MGVIHGPQLPSRAYKENPAAHKTYLHSICAQMHQSRALKAHFTGSVRNGTTSKAVQCRVFNVFQNMFDKNKQEKEIISKTTIDEELDDGAEMQPIDLESTGGLGGTSEEVFGPLAVLLVGFFQDEVEQIRTMMLDMEADMVKIIPCTQAMLKGTLQQALESEYPQYEQPRLGQQRAVFLSGMFGAEVVEVISAYRDAGLPPAAFAAAIPNNWSREVSELIAAMWRDQAAMNQKLREQQARES